MPSSTGSHANSDLVQKFLDGDLTADEQRQFDQQLDSQSFASCWRNMPSTTHKSTNWRDRGCWDLPLVERIPSAGYRRQMVWWSPRQYWPSRPWGCTCGDRESVMVQPSDS